MAEIFLAKLEGYSGFEKLVALKKILPRYSRNANFARMLIHEAKLAARLQHFNVVQVLDLGEVDHQVYIAMEYVRGRDLAALLSNTYRRKERLPVALSLCIATEFLTGLDYAHRLRDPAGREMGLIHRDISPQNVLISYEGEVKVTDFGIARVLSEDGFELPGTLHGKFGYMSPEQVLGHKLDQRSDIFSAGVVLHELLTGRRLFRAKDPRTTIDLIVHSEIEPPSTKNPDVPPEVDAVVMKALEKDRDVRFQTVGSLLGALSRIADALPERAARRDLAVYMRRQFGTTAGQQAGAPGGKAVPGVSQVAGFSPTAAGREPLGEILIRMGALTHEELEIGLAEQRARGGRIGEILVASQGVGEPLLVAALSRQSGIPEVEPGVLDAETPPAALARFPRDAAERTGALPLSLDPITGHARLCVSDPYDARALLEAKVVLGVGEVERVLGGRRDVREAILRWYGPPRVDPEAPEPTPLAVPALPVEEDAGPPVVLIADSHPELVAELAERVREEEYEVVTVTDGKAARDVCRQRNPIVVFVEAMLPGIDGYNILLDIRSRDADAAVFLTASRADDFHQSKAMDLGADDFVVKPFNVEVTASKIRREVQKRAGGRRSVAPPPVNFSGVSGALDEMPLLDIVQGLEIGRKSAVVVLQYDDGRDGQLAVREGVVQAASCGPELGEAAFFSLARPGSGLFRIEYRAPETEPNLARPNTFLILEALRRIDESGTPGAPAAAAGLNDTLLALNGLDLGALAEAAALAQAAQAPAPPSPAADELDDLVIEIDAAEDLHIPPPPPPPSLPPPQTPPSWLAAPSDEEWNAPTEAVVAPPPSRGSGASAPPPSRRSAGSTPPPSRGSAPPPPGPPARGPAPSASPPQPPPPRSVTPSMPPMPAAPTFPDATMPELPPVPSFDAFRPAAPTPSAPPPGRPGLWAPQSTPTPASGGPSWESVPSPRRVQPSTVPPPPQWAQPAVDDLGLDAAIELEPVDDLSMLPPLPDIEVIEDPHEAVGFEPAASFDPFGAPPPPGPAAPSFEPPAYEPFAGPPSMGTPAGPAAPRAPSTGSFDPFAGSATSVDPGAFATPDLGTAPGGGFDPFAAPVARAAPGASSSGPAARPAPSPARYDPFGPPSRPPGRPAAAAPPPTPPAPADFDPFGAAAPAVEPPASPSFDPFGAPSAGSAPNPSFDPFGAPAGAGSYDPFGAPPPLPRATPAADPFAAPGPASFDPFAAPPAANASPPPARPAAPAPDEALSRLSAHVQQHGETPKQSGDRFESTGFFGDIDLSAGIAAAVAQAQAQIASAPPSPPRPAPTPSTEPARPAASAAPEPPARTSSAAAEAAHSSSSASAKPSGRLARVAVQRVATTVQRSSKFAGAAVERVRVISSDDDEDAPRPRSRGRRPWQAGGAPLRDPMARDEDADPDEGS